MHHSPGDRVREEKRKRKDICKVTLVEAYFCSQTTGQNWSHGSNQIAMEAGKYRGAPGFGVSTSYLCHEDFHIKTRIFNFS